MVVEHILYLLNANYFSVVYTRIYLSLFPPSMDSLRAGGQQGASGHGLYPLVAEDCFQPVPTRHLSSRDNMGCYNATSSLPATTVITRWLHRHRRQLNLETPPGQTADAQRLHSSVTNVCESCRSLLQSRYRGCT